MIKTGGMWRMMIKRMLSSFLHISFVYICHIVFFLRFTSCALNGPPLGIQETDQKFGIFELDMFRKHKAFGKLLRKMRFVGMLRSHLRVAPAPCKRCCHVFCEYVVKRSHHIVVFSLCPYIGLPYGPLD